MDEKCAYCDKPALAGMWINTPEDGRVRFCGEYHAYLWLENGLRVR